MTTETTKTRIQLVNDVAKKLKIVGTGQQLEPEYAQTIDERVDPILLQLAADSVCTVVDDDAIPSEWYNCIVGLLANIVGPEFNVPYDPTLKQVYESELRRTTSSKATYEILAGTYF